MARIACLFVYEKSTMCPVVVKPYVIVFAMIFSSLARPLIRCLLFIAGYTKGGGGGWMGKSLTRHDAEAYSVFLKCRLIL